MNAALRAGVMRRIGARIDADRRLWSDLAVGQWDAVVRRVLHEERPLARITYRRRGRPVIDFGDVSRATPERMVA